MPALYFLSLKPSPIPRESYLRLMPLHIWLGRLLVIISTAHGVLYLVYFFKMGKQQNILHFANFAGVVITAGFVLTLLVSFYFIRHRNHELFYKTHLAFSWLCLPLLAYHARPRVWAVTILLLVCIGGQLFQRHGFGQESRLQIQKISRHTIVVSLPRKLFPKYFEPGSHIRLSPTRESAPVWFLSASHPYTIASLSADEDTVQLVVKPSRRFKLEEDREYIVHGPYPSLSYDFFVNMYKADKPLRRTVIIAGGVGISFAAPIAKTLIKMNERVKIIWAVRSKADLGLIKILGLEDADVFVSSNANDQSQDPFLQPVELQDTLPSSGFDAADPQYVGEPISDELGNEATEFGLKEGIKVTYGRLNIETELKEFKALADVDSGGMWVISCGSRRLVSECSKWGRRLGATVHEEVYDI
ncbi:hypothetical protein BZA70DRAFT_287385 [Myxozyma melibiosi]|uniref:FAD-binding FR-type domain-containing protein n=1 Tax=Myxozyma melibiosi TaxID=54550 RepID=A0ABR1FDX9_9ASCO